MAGHSPGRFPWIWIPGSPLSSQVVQMLMTFPVSFATDRYGASKARISGTVSIWGFQLVMGIPLYRWLVFVRENPTKIHDDWG